MTDIPQRIQELLNEDEVENVEDRNGYAFGNVALKNEDGEVEDRYENTIIELFNGKGGAGRFGGVRFMWADDSVEYDEPWNDDDEGYHESYAHATELALDQNGTLPAWYVEEYTSPENPDYGKRSP